MSRQREGGFTLTELIVVLVVLGILVSIAAPKFMATQSVDVPTHAERVRSLLRYGQRIAVAQNRPVYVDLTASRVTLCFDDGCASTVLGPNQANSGTSATTAACGSSWACEGTPSDLALSSTAAEFSFDATGRPFADGNDLTGNTSTFTTLTVTVSGGGQSATVVVEPETGYVH